MLLPYFTASVRVYMKCVHLCACVLACGNFKYNNRLWCCNFFRSSDRRSCRQHGTCIQDTELMRRRSLMPVALLSNWPSRGSTLFSVLSSSVFSCSVKQWGCGQSVWWNWMNYPEIQTVVSLTMKWYDYVPIVNKNSKYVLEIKYKETKCMFSHYIKMA